MNWISTFNLAGLSFATIMAMGGSVQVTLATESVAPSVPTGLPLGIMCWNERTKNWAVGYLATVEKDGTATYMPAGGQLSAKVSAKGMVESPKNRPAIFDCYGKTIEELRAIGRIIDFQHSP
ncbi:MAG: hypothetical protein AAAB35_08800 [Phyllobacterium sp.]|uniref:hypothetical protein n=1 Tax=Phyllobacterium sp. TaxID=1871046 RepID=UPI0030F27514